MLAAYNSGDYRAFSRDLSLPAKLIVDEPLPDGLPQGIVWIQYRTENCRILPVFGKEALNLSPRVGHLHVRVDDLPWLWADTSDSNTVDIGGMPPGENGCTAPDLRLVTRRTCASAFATQTSSPCRSYSRKSGAAE